MDSDMDGMIDFDEFVAATMHVHQLEESDSEKWESRSRAAFSKLDRDGDGYITPDELQTVCEPHHLNSFGHALCVAYIVY
jgi:calcium-dependent protein kinase